MTKTALFSQAHLREELGNGNLSMQDVRRVCRSGVISDEPEQDVRTGDWKYRIEGLTADGERAAVVFAFKEEKAVLVTVFVRR